VLQLAFGLRCDAAYLGSLALANTRANPLFTNSGSPGTALNKPKTIHTHSTANYTVH